MARITIPCLVARAGKTSGTSWFWQPSKTLRAAGFLPEALGKDEARAIDRARALNAEVEAWKNGGIVRAELARRRQSGTFGALIARYKREYLNGRKPDGSPLLRQNTRVSYTAYLPRLEAWAGQHPLAYITPARVKALRDAIARPRAAGGLGHATAYNMLRVLRQLLAFAESCDLIPKGSNPAADFGLGKPPARRVIWSAEDEAAFVAAAHDAGFPSLALAVDLAIYSGQREGDLIAFTEPQFGEVEILDPLLAARLADDKGRVRAWSFDQGKTSTEYAANLMQIPLAPALADRVEAMLRANRARDRAADPPRLVTHVLVDDRTGLPWGQNGFQRAVRAILDHAATRAERPQMRGLTWHDLRRTRVVRLRRRGMSKEMIASITGHDPKTIDEMLKVYGPIDPTITAAALASTLPDPAGAPQAEKKDRA